MVRIRKACCLDKFRLKKIISFLPSDAINSYTKVLSFAPCVFIHDLIPLKYKILPETYLLEENKEILGMVTVLHSYGNPYRLEISRLFLEHDFFKIGKQLIDFVISRYGAKGASSFIAKIDESQDELLSLFVEGCGFRHCSSESLWRVERIRFSNPSASSFIRPFKNSDAKEVAALFNDSLITHFKHSLSRDKNEYKELLFKGLNDNYTLKFVIEDNKSKKIISYFSISTSDNKNYILNVTSAIWCDCPFDDLFEFALRQLSRRQKDFNLFVRVRKYLSTADTLESFIVSKESEFIRNQIVLVKDFYKIIKENNLAQKILLFNEIGEKPVFKN